MNGRPLDPVVRRRIIVTILIFVMIIIAFTIPLPERYDGIGFIEPASSWSIDNTYSSQITVGLNRDLLNDNIPNRIFHFQRPDVVELHLRDKISEGLYINKGDTLGFLQSSEGRVRIATLKTDIMQEIASREALATGSRAADLRVACRKLERAEVELATFAPEYKRVSALRDSSLISETLYDEANQKYKVLKAERELAKAEMEALKEGAKPEDVAVSEAKLAGMESQLVQERLTMGDKIHLTAPFAGIVHLKNGNGQFLQVVRTDTFAVRLQFPEDVTRLLKVGDEVVLDFPSQKLPSTPVRICKTGQYYINDKPLLVNDLPVYVAWAILSDAQGYLQEGLRTIATFNLGKRTLAQKVISRIRL